MQTRLLFTRVTGMDLIVHPVKQPVRNELKTLIKNSVACQGNKIRSSYHRPCRLIH